jgi:hypothetical protein
LKVGRRLRDGNYIRNKAVVDGILDAWSIVDDPVAYLG